MITKQFDPSDLRPSTIEQLFYRQFNDLTMKTSGVNARMDSFDRQFSDSWL